MAAKINNHRDASKLIQYACTIAIITRRLVEKHYKNSDIAHLKKIKKVTRETDGKKELEMYIVINPLETVIISTCTSKVSLETNLRIL